MTSLIKSEEEHDDNDKRWGYENLQHNQWRRMKLQIDLQSQQRNHRLSRAAWLQGRWLEVSKQERRAQLHNQKLLQDFQRAQDTLDDMVARTEAMNTIRVQYERYLEENFPRWQQKLKDVRVSEQSKRVQKHLQNYVHQMEEEQGIKADHRSDTTAHPLFSNFPDHSQLPTSHTLPTAYQPDKGQNAARCNQNNPSCLPPTWLTGSQPSFIPELPQNNIPKDYKNFHNIQALSHHLPSCYSLPCDSHHQPQQKSSSTNHMYQNPWTCIRPGLIPTGHFTPPGASWPQLPVLNPMAWGMMDVPEPGVERNQCSETYQKNTKEMLKPFEESNQRLKHKRKGRERDQSSELDCRPVRLLIDHEDSSEGSAPSSEIVKVSVSGIKERRKKRKDRTESKSTVNGRKSQSSSTVSQDAPLSDLSYQADPKKKKKLKKPAEQDNNKEATMTKKDTDALIQDEEDEQEESKSHEITPSHAGSNKTDEPELNQKNSREEDDTDKGENNHDLVAEEEITDRKRVDEGDEERVEGIDDEEEAGLDDEEESEGNETEHRDGEEKEGDEDIPDYIPDSGSEEGAEKTERETKKNSSQDELVKEAKGTLKNARKDVNKSDEEESDDNVDISERNVHMNNSIKELYGDDETEEEEVYNQEIVDDDCDESVVEKAHPWTEDPLYDETKSTDDDDKDIEDLLNPHVSSQTHKEDDVEETDQSNDLHSDSDLPKKSVPAATNKPVESDDEFDHFYD